MFGGLNMRTCKNRRLHISSYEMLTSHNNTLHPQISPPGGVFLGFLHGSSIEGAY